MRSTDYPMNKTRISKLDAARRQLDISINLFFYDRDLVAIHTLAAAAFNVLADLLKQQGRSERTLRGKLLESVKKEHQVTVLRKVREAENFFKHADRDPEEIS